MSAKKILTIDDDDSIRLLLKVLLKQAGYEVEGKGSAEEGLEELKNNKYDILLLDIILPEQTGIDILPEVVKNYPDMDVIMISGYGDMGVVMDCFRMGAYDYIAKPFSKDYLVSSVERCTKKELPPEVAHEYDENVNFLYDVSKAIKNPMPIDKLAETIILAGMKTLKTDSGSLMLVDEEAQELVLKKTLGLNKDKIKTNRVKIGEGISGWVAKEKKPLLFVDEYEDNPEFKKNEPCKDIKSAVIVPLVLEDKLVGVLNVNNVVSERKLSDQDLKMMTIFSKDCARAIVNLTA